MKHSRRMSITSHSWRLGQPRLPAAYSIKSLLATPSSKGSCLVDLQLLIRVAKALHQDLPDDWKTPQRHTPDTDTATKTWLMPKTWSYATTVSSKPRLITVNKAQQILQIVDSRPVAFTRLPASMNSRPIASPHPSTWRRLNGT